jgi:hypothetical protein
MGAREYREGGASGYVHRHLQHDINSKRARGVKMAVVRPLLAAEQNAKK